VGIKCGYSSPQTLTDQSPAIKRGQKGDFQVLRLHLMYCVPVRIENDLFKKILYLIDNSWSCS
jgi:long-chain acyl-CoA synthetase